MKEQMHYATYGRSRHRRVKLGGMRARRGDNRRMQELKSEQQNLSSRTEARVRRKYKQTSRSKSPTPTSARKSSSASPLRRRPSIQMNSERERKAPAPTYLDRKPRLVRSKSLDERPRQLHQQKQKEFHRQMSEFDFFEEKSAHNSKIDAAIKPDSTKSDKRGAKFVRSAKSFFKDNMPCKPTIFISGNTCKKYSYFLQSRFRTDGGSIGYERDRDQASSMTVTSKESADGKSFASSSSDECSSESDEDELTVEIEEVNMSDDASERSHELESEFGSHTGRLSSLTSSQDPYKRNEFPGFSSREDQANLNDDQIMKLTKELVILLDENESLRGNINDLRRKFEAMLKQIQAIAEGNEKAFGDDSSVQTEDSRVSHCLLKIDQLKLDALEKFKEVVENHQADKGEELLSKRERDMKSYEECIEDLLRENERLFHNVVTLSKELKEVQQHQQDHVSSDTSIAAKPDYMLTDEKEAECQHRDLDKIAVLLKNLKMTFATQENEDEPTEAEDDIMSLVSKIMVQQPCRKTLHLSDLPVVKEDGEQVQEANDDRFSTEGEQEQEASDDRFSAEGEQIDFEEEYDETSSEIQCDDIGYISGADDDDFSYSSNCSDSSVNSSDDNSEAPQEYEVSEDSMLVKKSPAFIPNTNNHGDDTSASGSLEVIYEYYSSDSEGSTSSAVAQHPDYGSKSGHKQEDSQNSAFSSGDGSPSFGSIESAYYFFHGGRSRSRSSSTSRSRSTSTFTSATSPSRSRSASRPRSSRRDRLQIVPRRRSSSLKSQSPKGGSTQDEDESNLHPNNAAQEEEITNAINSKLDPMLFDKSTRSHTMSTSASISASDSSTSAPTLPSFSSDSTKEHKAIAITVVCRSSRHVSFPSTRAHTFVSFFTVSMRKNKVDAILEEQLSETVNVSSTNNNTKKNKKYKGEYNQDGQRHGYGIYTSRNGNEYRGEWLNNKREGLGVVKVGNGDAFEGQFQGNLKNGVGVYHYQDGECDLSRYENDHRVGESIRWSADRQQAFLLTEKPSVREISLEEAADIAFKMDIVVVTY